MVTLDCSGDFRIILEVVAASAHHRDGDSRSTANLMLLGDGRDATVVTGSKNVHDGITTTLRSATFESTNMFLRQNKMVEVSPSNHAHGWHCLNDFSSLSNHYDVPMQAFIFDCLVLDLLRLVLAVITGNVMTFENTAGPEKNQAKGYQATVIYRCGFKGYQGTHYVHSQRQLIYGTVDFIFGDAVAALQSCNIFVRDRAGTGRPQHNNTGISIHCCIVVIPAVDLKPVQERLQDLPRPWRKYSRTVFMKTSLSSLADPPGGSSGTEALH
nr:PREDICTED: probable pectinesterase/pectinesterase inhibitor 6 [Musa acuminata subsp. malaccensis]